MLFFLFLIAKRNLHHLFFARQCPADGFQQLVIDLFLPGKSQFHFGRMHIHIHRRPVHLQVKQRERIFMLHHRGMVPILDGFRQQLALHISVIDVIVFKVPVSTGNHRLPDKAGNLHQLAFSLDLNQFPGNVSSVNVVNQLADIPVSAGMQLRLMIDHVFKRHLRMGKRKLLHHSPHRIGLRRGRPQELFPCRCIVKQVFDDKRRPFRRADLLEQFFLSALDQIPDALEDIRYFCDHLNLCHSRNTGKRLSPKAQGCDACQFLHRPELACGMAQKRRAHLIRRDSGTIVRDPDQADPSVFDLHGDRRCVGIQGVFHQLLYHRCRTLHDFSRCDLIDRRLIQYFNFLYHNSCQPFSETAAGGIFGFRKVKTPPAPEISPASYHRFLILFCRRYRVFSASIGVRFVISSSRISSMIESSCTVSNSDICCTSSSS